jgi:hypothetical protein
LIANRFKSGGSTQDLTAPMPVLKYEFEDWWRHGSSSIIFSFFIILASWLSSFKNLGQRVVEKIIKGVIHVQQIDANAVKWHGVLMLFIASHTCARTIQVGVTKTSCTIRVRAVVVAVLTNWIEYLPLRFCFYPWYFTARFRVPRGRKGDFYIVFHLVCSRRFDTEKAPSHETTTPPVATCPLSVVDDRVLDSLQPFGHRSIRC